jgi:hypothetical protein
MRNLGPGIPPTRLARALVPTLLAFTATTTGVVALGWSAHWWLGLLAGFPAVIVAEAGIAQLDEFRRTSWRGPARSLARP